MLLDASSAIDLFPDLSLVPEGFRGFRHDSVIPILPIIPKPVCNTLSLVSGLVPHLLIGGLPPFDVDGGVFIRWGSSSYSPSPLSAAWEDVGACGGVWRDVDEGKVPVHVRGEER